MYPFQPCLPLQPSSYTPIYLSLFLDRTQEIQSLFLSFVFPPRPRSTSSNISSPRSLGERDWVLSDGPQAELRPALFLFIPLYPLFLLSVLSTELSTALHVVGYLREIPRPPLSFSQIAQRIIQRSCRTILTCMCVCVCA